MTREICYLANQEAVKSVNEREIYQNFDVLAKAASYFAADDRGEPKGTADMLEDIATCVTILLVIKDQAPSEEVKIQLTAVNEVVASIVKQKIDETGEGF